jgi:hypothetical protein
MKQHHRVDAAAHSHEDRLILRAEIIFVDELSEGLFHGSQS